MFIAIFYLLWIYYPRSIHHGFKEEKFDELYFKSYEYVLLYEIGSNRSAVEWNATTASRQNRRLNIGILLTYISGAVFTILIVVSQIDRKDYPKNQIEEKTEIMGKQDSTSSSGNDNGQSIQETQQQVSPIPRVPREDLSTYEKGDTTEYDKK